MQYRLYRTHITLFLMLQNQRKEYTMILFPFLLATTVGLLLVIAGALPFASASAPDLKNATLLTPDQIAAGGPIPPNYTLAQQEVECTAAEQNAPCTLLCSVTSIMMVMVLICTSAPRSLVHLLVPTKFMHIDLLKDTILHP